MSPTLCYYYCRKLPFPKPQSKKMVGWLNVWLQPVEVSLSASAQQDWKMLVDPLHPHRRWAAVHDNQSLNREYWEEIMKSLSEFQSGFLLVHLAYIMCPISAGGKGLSCSACLRQGKSILSAWLILPGCTDDCSMMLGAVFAS